MFPEKGRHAIEMSDLCKDFVWRLLNKNPVTRLGTDGDVKAILEHPWLKSISSEAILKKEIPPVLRPTLSTDMMDISNFCGKMTSQELDHSMIPQKKLGLIIRNQSDFSDFASVSYMPSTKLKSKVGQPNNSAEISDYTSSSFSEEESKS